MKPKISIIIPFYNADKYISRMLDSLLNQNLKEDEYEIVVVDDGSKDDSQILMDYVHRFKNIKYIRQVNSGPGAARNTGIDNAIGEYIFFCDSDDYVAENTIGNLYDIDHGRGLDMLFFGVPRVAEDEVLKNSRRNFSSAKEFCTGQEFFAQPIDDFFSMGVWQFIISKSFIISNNIRFPSDMIMNEDACFLMDAIMLSKRTAKVDSDIYFYVQNPLSSIHFSGKVLQAEKWTNNILIFISKLNTLINDKQLRKEMPEGCLNNLLWLKNHKSYIVLKAGCKYLPPQLFKQLLYRLVKLDSYPMPLGNFLFLKKIIFKKNALKFFNILYGIKRKNLKK